MTDTRIATVRTSWFATFAALVAFAAARLGFEIDTNDPLFMLAAPVVVGIGYRAALALSEAVPWVGYVFFGVNRSPGYTDPPPAFPAVAEEGPA